MIKSTATKNTANPIEKCPCLMETKNGVIILMTRIDSDTGTGVGTVVTGNNINSVGFHTDSWDVEQLSPYEGRVTLSSK